MKNSQKRFLYGIIITGCLIFLCSVHGFAQSFPVQGTVIKAQVNTPVPGLTVSLVHPRLGRSTPATTNRFGQYFFYNIPAQPEPYFLEVYWGQQLVFRTALRINGPTLVPVIYL